jgi:hypothetical protein
LPKPTGCRLVSARRRRGCWPNQPCWQASWRCSRHGSRRGPLPVAADRSGTTLTRVLPDTTAATITAHFEAAIESDALLVTDGAPFFPPCARSLGVSHEPLDHKAGERRRGDLHLDTVNSRHERLETFLRGRRGIATEYLDSFAWRFNRRYQLDTMTERLMWAGLQAKPRPYRVMIAG